MGGYFAQGYGVVAADTGGVGMALHFCPQPKARCGLRGCCRCFAILSFTLCFNFAALRSDDRFLLPQAVLACVYIGIAAEALAFAAADLAAACRRGCCLAVTALLALHQVRRRQCGALLLDPRYDAEALDARRISGRRHHRDLWPELLSCRAFHRAPA